jgi:thioredoxin reductase (NADPH)
MSARVTANPKIEVVWNSIPLEVLGVPENAVRGLRVQNVLNAQPRDIPLSGVFVAIGHKPNTAAFASALDVDSNGYFVPLSGSSVKTKIPGVYVAGDCADHVYRQAITAAGMGCQAAIDAERWLAENADSVLSGSSLETIEA